jgi:hypothetical protein
MEETMKPGLLVAALVGAAVAFGQLANQPPLDVTPKPTIPNAKPVRSCESLAMVALPNTTIESAAVDANNLSNMPRDGYNHAPARCRQDQDLDRHTG